MSDNPTGGLDKQLRGISDDAIEAAAHLVEKLGALPNLAALPVEQFAKLAAADIRALKSFDD